MLIAARYRSNLLSICHQYVIRWIRPHVVRSLVGQAPEGAEWVFVEMQIVELSTSVRQRCEDSLIQALIRSRALKLSIRPLR